MDNMVLAGPLLDRQKIKSVSLRLMLILGFMYRGMLPLFVMIASIG